MQIQPITNKGTIFQSFSLLTPQEPTWGSADRAKLSLVHFKVIQLLGVAAALWSLKHEGHKFKASLGYMVGHCLKKKSHKVKLR
jgi:hypothetical protein